VGPDDFRIKGCKLLVFDVKVKEGPSPEKAMCGATHRVARPGTSFIPGPLQDHRETAGAGEVDL